MRSAGQPSSVARALRAARLVDTACDNSVAICRNSSRNSRLIELDLNFNWVANVFNGRQFGAVIYSINQYLNQIYSKVFLGNHCIGFIASVC